MLSRQKTLTSGFQGYGVFNLTSVSPEKKEVGLPLRHISTPAMLGYCGPTWETEVTSQDGRERESDVMCV